MTWKLAAIVFTLATAATVSTQVQSKAKTTMARDKGLTDVTGTQGRSPHAHRASDRAAPWSS